MIDLNNLPTNIDKQVFNATIADGGPYKVGQLALGGVIAYVLQPGDPGYDANLQKGFVATKADQSAGAVWGCNGTLLTGASGTAIGTGNQNTIDIMAGCAEAGIAARLCGDLVEGGYSDWYLPSIDELNKLYLNRVAIGGFTTNYYWSSTQQDLYSAWFYQFGSDYRSYFSKTNACYVRAIRSFSEPIPDKPWENWQTWTKPSKASQAYIICIGGGGGGGGGQSGIAGTARLSGSGGGSSAVTIAQIPFYLILDTLYISVGKGGVGGLVNTNGGSGNISYISCYPTTNLNNCIITSGGPANGGGPTAVGGSGGAALVASDTSPRYLSLCSWASYGGQAGATFGSTTGIDIAALSNSITSGGASGGGVPATNTSNAGGNITSSDLLTSFIKPVSGGSAGGGNGNNGYSYLKPFFSVGGSGGGGNPSGTGGNGGNGIIGSGGGGGAAGLTGGAGGNGGDGLVMIISY